MPVGLPGRLSKGAGTHLASWLQETTALTAEEGQALLDGTARPAAGPRAPLAERAEAGLWAAHGARAGHAKPVSDVAHSGDLLARWVPAPLLSRPGSPTGIVSTLKQFS